MEDRQRATVACSNCRRLKEKCDGQVPCERCLKHGRHCQTAPSEPRPKSSSISSSKNEGAEERLRYLEAIAEHFLDDVPTSNEALRQVAIDLTAQEGGSSELAPNAAESLTLEREDFTVRPVTRGMAHYSGELSHWNFSERLRGYVDKGQSEVTNGSSLEIKDFWRADDLRCSETLEQLNYKSLPPWDVATFLLKVYFDYAQTNSFFVERAWATEKLQRLYESVHTLGADDAAWICAVLMILAIGSQFAHMGGGLQGALVTVDGASEDAVSVTLYRLAAKFIPDTLVLASMESVQACLLVAHFALPLDTHGLGYTYAGMAIHIAVQNGMHRVYCGNDLTEEDIDLRNRLWWSCWALEMRITVLHGRPSSTLDAYKDAAKPRDIGTPERTRELTLLRLIEILHEFSNMLHRLQRCPPRLRAESLQRVIKSKTAFEKWWSEQRYSSAPVMKECRQSAQLHLYYHISLVYLCRPFILSRSYSKQPPSSGPQPPGPLDKLAEDAVTSACHIIDILAVIDNTIGLARASYIEFSSCRAATMVILAASLTNKTEELAMTRTLAMQTINKMAISIVASQSDASLLTAIDASIRRMDEDKGAATQFTTSLHAETEQAKYNTFKKWATNRQVEQSDYSELREQAERDMLQNGFIEPLSEQTPATSNNSVGDLADTDGLFDGFEWSLFDASLFELDDDNMKDLFSNFDNW